MPTRRFLDFSPFRWDAVNRSLFRDGELVQMRPKALETLSAFLQRPGELILKGELKAAIWPESKFVGDNNLDQQVAELRRILGDSPIEPHFIETVPKRGYRFIAEITTIVDDNHVPIWVSAKSAFTHFAQYVIGRGSFPWKLARALAGIALILAVAAGVFLRSHDRRKLTEKDIIVLSDFDNATGDQVFDGTLRQGLSSQLEQSPFLNLLSDDRVAEALALMAQPKTTKLTGRLVREVCQRTGSSISMEGSISNLGSQFVLWIKAVDCSSGELRAEEQTTAAAKETVLPALGRIATKIRSKLGESSASVQKFDVPLEQVTTPSLEALHAYSLGSQTLILKNDSTAAIGFFQRAVAIDPNFAMAYARLAASYSNAGEAGRSAESISKAYELRARVSAREKFYISSHFEHLATGDLEAARRIYEMWSQTYPRDADPLGDLDTVYYGLGDYDKALDVAQKSLKLRPASGLDIGNLVFAYLNVNRLAEAIAVAHNAEALHVDSSFTHEPLYLVAFLRHDTVTMQRQVAASRGKSGVEDVMIYYQSDTLAYSGELKKARQFTQAAVAYAHRANENETAAQYEVEASLREALVGNFDLSKHLADSALVLSKGRDVEAVAATALALAGNSAHVSLLTAELNTRFPQDTLVKFLYVPMIDAAAALGSGDAEMAAKAIQALNESAPFEMGSPAQPINIALYPVYFRGEAYLAARQANSATTEFEKIVDYPGVVTNEPIGALAYLGLGRAYSMAGDSARAQAAYHEFLTLWKNADAATPIFQQALAEFTKLQSSP